MDNDSPSNFIERLKRHYIFRIAAIYAVAGWIIIQLFNTVLPSVGFPKDTVRFVIILVTLGFPVMLILAWTFIKPKGVEDTEPSNWTRLRLRLGSALSVIIIVLVGISGWYLWGLAQTAQDAQVLATIAPVAGTQHVFSPPPRSIAVLPFTNLSNVNKQLYFSDGITEEITGALGALPGIRVISWQSTSIYRGTNMTVPEIGNALNVANILQGSIRRDGEQVRVSAELVSTVTGYQLWSAHYDRTFKDVFAIQDDISRAIVSALQLHLSSNAPLVAVATNDTNAHDFYLKGLEALNSATAESLNAAIRDFQQAIRLDPRYAQAYAALARTYAVIHQYTNISLKESLPLARRAAREALRLNPNLAAAHEALGMTYALQQKRSRAIAELRRAMELDPNNAKTHIIYATLLPAGEYKEMLAQYQQAVVLDPNQAFAHYNLAYVYERLGNYMNAITEYQATIGLAPELVFPRLDLARLYHRNADDKSAMAILTGVKTDDPLETQILGAARLVYMAQQTPDLNNQALAALRKIDISKISASDKEELVTLNILVGQESEAILLLTQVCANAPETCTDLAVNPSYEILRGEQKFQKLAKKYNLKN